MSKCSSQQVEAKQIFTMQIDSGTYGLLARLAHANERSMAAQVRFLILKEEARVMDGVNSPIQTQQMVRKVEQNEQS